MEFLTFFLLFFACNAFACRPSADFKFLSKEEIFKIADSVAIVKVEKNSGSPDGEITVKLLQSLKGKNPSRIIVRTSPSTCDPLGYDAVPGSYCLLFMKGNRTLSGLFGGHASVCDSSDQTEKWKKEVSAVKK